MSKLKKLFQKLDIAFANDAAFQSHVKLSALSALPASVFIPLWIAITPSYSPDILAESFKNNCRLQQVFDQSAPLLSGQSQSIAVSIDEEKLQSCVSMRTHDFNEEQSGLNHRMKYMSLIGFLLLYFTWTQGEKAATRMKELESQKFFDQHGFGRD